MLPFCVLVKLQHRSAASPRPASSRRNLCSLSDSALDCSFSFVFPNFQLSTFDFQPPLFPKSFTCHISENGPVSPLVATLKDRPASVANKRLTAKLSPLSATLTKNRGGVLPTRCSAVGRDRQSLPSYFTSLPLHSASPIAAKRLWCNNSQRHENSLLSGETTPLPPVSNTRERTSGTVRQCSRSETPIRSGLQVVPGSSVLKLDRSRVARATHPCGTES
jgi:hypothetical protein